VPRCLLGTYHYHGILAVIRHTSYDSRDLVLWLQATQSCYQNALVAYKFPVAHGLKKVDPFYTEN
jgi:hypothetical protein